MPAWETYITQCSVNFSVVPGIFGDQQNHYIEVIKQMLAQSLAAHDQPSVWFEAVKATTAFLTTNEGEASIVHHFRDLLPGVIQVTWNCHVCTHIAMLTFVS